MAEISLEQCQEVVDRQLVAFGLDDSSLGSISLPVNKYAEDGDGSRVPYNVYGSPSAPNIVLKSAPYLTEVTSPHYQLRLLAHQRALGEEYCVIGVWAYDPRMSLSRKQREQTAAGSFSRLAERVLLVAQQEGITAEQTVIPEGFSLGGDIAIQVAHDVHFDPNKGIIKVEGLSAVEYARCRERGALAVIGAMSASGKDLFKNIKESKVPALLEAWGMTERTPKFVFDARVGLDALTYMMRGLRNNKAMISAFSSDASTAQLERLAKDSRIKRMVLRANERSTVCSRQEQQKLASRYPQKVVALTRPEDHSADDNIRMSAADLLQATRILAAA